MGNKPFMGMVEVYVPLSIENLLNRACQFDLQMVQLRSQDDGVLFCCGIDQLKVMKKCFPEGKVIKVMGLAGLVGKIISKPFCWFLMIWVIVLYFVLSHTIIKVDFQSTNDDLKFRIMEYLHQNEIVPGALIVQSDFVNELKYQLKHEFLHDLSWLEVSRKGSLLSIRFSHKETVHLSEFTHDPLVSYKHAVVVKFDVLHGYKCVQLNQVVHPGDVLVQPFLVNSKGMDVPLYVSGKVYGLTWTTVDCELESDKPMDVFDFLRLLYACRKQIELEIDEDEQVLKENILQVNRSEGTIRMTVHYTCIEDITKQ